MKQTLSRMKLLVLLNLLLLLVYMGYNEWKRLQPEQIQTVCQLLGVDQEKNLLGLNCLIKHNPPQFVTKGE
mgnify:CR=1 FL=1